MPVCCCCGMSLGVTQTQAVRRANTRNISSLLSVISYWQSNRPPLLLSLDRVYNSSASTRLSMIFFWKRQTRSESRASNIGKWNQTGMAMTLGRKDLCSEMCRCHIRWCVAINAAGFTSISDPEALSPPKVIIFPFCKVAAYCLEEICGEVTSERRSYSFRISPNLLMCIFFFFIASLYMEYRLPNKPHSDHQRYVKVSVFACQIKNIPSSYWHTIPEPLPLSTSEIIHAPG